VKVSRSFAMVIQQLPEHLRLSVCIFYLVLRGLDTVEDDMKAFEGRQQVKLAHLRNFDKYLKNPDWTMHGVGEGDEALLLQQFNMVNQVYLALPPIEQEVIGDICARMGEGMASFAGRDLREGTVDVADYNLYCHYVAGLVGEGLSRLFVAHGDEAPIVAKDLKLADDMGLFLQKTNIIRDYLEDLVEGRAFWPRDIWSQYAPALANLRYKVTALATSGGSTTGAATEAPEAGDDARFQEDQARACLNHLIADALTLAPSCLRYMERLQHPEIFRFCAIPQVMAIATLDKLTNNADVFTGVVKIRKGQALVLMKNATSMNNLYSVFLKHTRSILANIPPHHKAAYGIASRAAAQVEAICLANLPQPTVSTPFFSTSAVAFVFIVLLFLGRHLYSRSKSGAWNGNSLPRITDSMDVAVLTGAVACVMYLFACAGVPLVLGAGGAASPSAPSSPIVTKAAPPMLDEELSKPDVAGAAKRRSNRMRA
jgi:farnesyl-diphosphate farnesyltransferase